MNFLSYFTSSKATVNSIFSRKIKVFLLINFCLFILFITFYNNNTKLKVNNSKNQNKNNIPLKNKLHYKPLKNVTKKVLNSHNTGSEKKKKLQLKKQKISNDKISKTLKKYDQFAVSIKTGRGSALNRLPIQLVTFLQDVDINKVLFIGESPNITVGNVHVEDVCTTLYDNFTEQPKDWKVSMELLQKEVKENKIPKPGEKTEGWKMDAHKNLPGFVKLYNKFPDAKWYVMLDDDTYMFFGNLELLVEKYNPNDEHYIGAGTLFNGCDGVTKFGDGPEFAHGGSGIVISQGAMKKMIKNVNTCILRYRDCWAGDVRTSLCLRDQGILLKSLPGFNNITPDKFSFPKNACERPLTFHHLLVKHFQKLHLISRNKLKAVKPDSNVYFSTPNYADIYEAYNSYDESNLYEKDFDRKGSDYKDVNCSNAETCQKICSHEAKCVAWTFLDNQCWLKDAIPEGETVTGHISGVILNKYKCQEEKDGRFFIGNN